MGDVLALLLVVLIAALMVAMLLAVMLRASKAQRRRTGRTDFGGRYSDFGFILGMLRGTDHKQDEAKVSPVDRDER